MRLVCFSPWLPLRSILIASPLEPLAVVRLCPSVIQGEDIFSGCMALPTITSLCRTPLLPLPHQPWSCLDPAWMWFLPDGVFLWSVLSLSLCAPESGGNSWYLYCWAWRQSFSCFECTMVRCSLPIYSSLIMLLSWKVLFYLFCHENV